MRWLASAVVLAVVACFCIEPLAPAVAQSPDGLRIVPAKGSAVFRGESLPLTLHATTRTARCNLLAAPATSPDWVRLQSFDLHPRRPLRVRIPTRNWEAGDWRLRASCPRGHAEVLVSVLEPPAWDSAVIALGSAVPAFDFDIHDYAVRSTDASSGCAVTVVASLPPGIQLTIDGQRIAPGWSTRIESLEPAQGFRIRAQRGSEHRSYSVRCLPADFPSFSVEGTGTAEWYVGDLTFDAESGDFGYLLDRHGTPVWWVMDPGGRPVSLRAWTAEEVAALGLRGEHAISWFSQSQPVLDTLDGNVVELPWVSDRHDLQPSGTGTLYSFRYRDRPCSTDPTECVDMTAHGGTEVDTVTDAEIRESDLEGNVVWEWNSRDHIPLEWTSRLLYRGFATAYRDGTWDLVHVNSIEPIEDDVLISMRNIDALLRIDKQTGQIIWKLGGTPSPVSLQVVDASGQPMPDIPLGGQHTARVLPDGTITAYDNGSLLARLPRAIRFRVDDVARTATVIETAYHPRLTQGSACCGGIRRLENGNWVGAWGPHPLAGEISPGGDAVFTVSFDARHGPYRFEPVADGVLSGQALRRAMDIAFEAHRASRGSSMLIEGDLTMSDLLALRVRGRHGTQHLPVPAR